MKKSRSRKPTRRRRATITVCVIARDEERFIADCLASVLPFVDEIVVLDTGSTDRTVEIARTFTPRVEHFEWQNDFAAARNAAIDLATSDWILMLDADERLQATSGPALRTFVESRPVNAPFYSPRIENRVNATTDDFRMSYPNRLLPRGPNVRYVGRIHEDLVYLPDPARSLGLRLDSVRITHLGYLPDVVETRHKLERNRRLLLLAMEAKPDDPLPRYYLGMDRVSRAQPAEAAEYFRQSLARTNHRPGWTAVPQVYASLVWAYAQLKDYAQLTAIADEAERAGMLSAGARCDLASSLVDRGLYAEAVRHLLAALEPGQPLVSVDRPGIGGWMTRIDLARLYEHMGDPAAALGQLELALADPDVPARGDVALDAVRLAVQLGDMASLARCLDAVPEPDEADLEGTIRLLEWRAAAGPSPQPPRGLSAIDRAVARGDWHSAADAAIRLAAVTRADAARMIFVATRLEGAGDPASALPLLERLYDTQPELPQLHWVLSKVLADLGRFDDALAANQILQDLLAAETRPTAA